MCVGFWAVFFRNGARFAGFGQDFSAVLAICRKSFLGFGLRFFTNCRGS